MSRQIPHRIVYGQGAETLYHVSRDRHGRPTVVGSATYVILDMREGETSSQREVVASTAATLDSGSATTSAAAGRSTADATLLTVDDASDFAEGDRILVAATDGGHRELATVHATTATTINTRAPLSGVYASGSSVSGIEMSGVFPSSEANDADETVEDGGGMYQIVWTYTIDGEVWNVAEPIWVTRYSLQPWATEEEVIRKHPAIKKRVSPTTMSDALVHATEDVAAALEIVGKDPRQFRLGLAGRLAVIYGALAYIFDQFGGEEDARLAEKYEERSMYFREGLTTGRTPYQTQGHSLSHDEPTTAATESDFFAAP